MTTNINTIMSQLTHQELGERLELFMTHPYTSGSVFMLPHGTKIYNTLQNYLRNEYKKRNYQEVITPQLANIQLWKESGHWNHYQQNMFNFNIDNNDEKPTGDESDCYSLKPMNCPMHCLMFKRKSISYKLLPLRIADFGNLHRNELSGALRGLTRLRKFTQDDAHIFCTYEQISSEIKSCLEFLNDVYNKFGFNYRITLSTRPDKFIGDIELWNTAEQALIKTLNEMKIVYSINEKDGAFYGPKIDVMLKDSLEREHQCGTIQLDFQLPERFDLSYIDNDNKKSRPVIIHRAILGSIERMMAILIEHYQGKLPMWISPRQISIIPVSNKPEFIEYCDKIVEYIKNNTQIDSIDIYKSSETFTYRIRESELMFYNYTIIIGKNEMKSDQITFRHINHERKDLTIDFTKLIEYII